MMMTMCGSLSLILDFLIVVVVKFVFNNCHWCNYLEKNLLHLCCNLKSDSVIVLHCHDWSQPWLRSLPTHRIQGSISSYATKWQLFSDDRISTPLSGYVVIFVSLFAFLLPGHGTDIVSLWFPCQDMVLTLCPFVCLARTWYWHCVSLIPLPGHVLTLCLFVCLARTWYWHCVPLIALPGHGTDIVSLCLPCQDMVLTLCPFVCLVRTWYWRCVPLFALPGHGTDIVPLCLPCQDMVLTLCPFVCLARTGITDRRKISFW